jgi:aminoglycoside phosphotransferase (APT) family kinase protein
LPAHHWDFEPEILKTLLPAIGEQCNEAQKLAIPATLVHGDFHGMNIVRSGGETLFFDWSHANVSHPFFDVMELLSADDWLPAGVGIHETLRDIYLSEWLEFAELDRLRVLYETLRPLWFLTQSLGSERTLDGMEASVPLTSRQKHSCAEWATQQQQYGLAVQLRELIAAMQSAKNGAGAS